tara:strand:+ start:25896 stop:27086 length:1191 start_codon:yes stop_codon:yes gene_type:complete
VSGNIPTLANSNHFTVGVNRESVEDKSIEYEYLKEATFQQFSVNYASDTKDRLATVLFDESRHNGWFLSSLLPWGGNDGQQAFRVKVHGDDDHLPMPCGLTEALPPERGLIEQYKLFTCGPDMDISPGDVVYVNYLLGPNQTRQSVGVIARKATGKTTLPERDPNGGCSALQDRFEEQDGQGASQPLGNRAGGNPNSAHVMNDLVGDAPSVAADQIIEGSALSGLESVVEGELSFWEGKREADPRVYRRLKTYWDNINFGDNWTPSGVPWSAAFISYVVQRIDPNFPGSAAHWLYSQSSADGEGGWTLWKTSEGNIRAQVGDILVRQRSGGRTNTHGDVVYKIEGNQAILAGGNLADTAKIASRLYVSSDGFYQDTGDYEIVLKRYGRVTNEANVA